MSFSLPATRFDILGIGNAIVDVVSPTGDDFLSRHDLRKGGMALISAEQAEALYAAMPPGQESSGGSAANTCAVAAGLGARVAFMGKVADDPLGTAFRRDIMAAGVHFPTAPLQGGAADIIKRAMTRLPTALAEAGLAARLLLQVHDELLFEATEAEAGATAAVAKQVMEGAARLSVPLVVETGTGRNWAAAH